MRPGKRPEGVTAYIADFPPATRKLLRELRSLIRKTVPQTEEKISYGMPGYTYHGMLAYFAGYARHIGFYPGTRAIVRFQNRLKTFKTSKGTVQFPLDQPLPATLIKDMLRWLKKEKESKLLLNRTR